MDAYIYQADIYCADCGRAIRRLLKRKGTAPARPQDERSYDSDQYPKGPFPDGGGESDCPEHCANGERCLNAETLSDGFKGGCFLRNPITSAGASYVAEYVAQAEADGKPNCVTAQWAEFYAEELAQLEN